MNAKLKTDAVDHLFEAILTLETKEDCYKFFEDVCTIKELLAMPVFRRRVLGSSVVR